MRQALRRNLLIVFLGSLLVALGSNQARADAEKLDFGFIVSTVTSTTGTGMLQGFITVTIRAERGRVFRAAEGIGPSPILVAPGFDATFEWVVSRRRKGSAQSDTILQVSNLDAGDSITIDRQYFDQDGDDCTRAGLGSIVLDPGESVMIHVSEELMPVCP